MVAPLLTTKLHIPPPRPNLIVRPRLLERLDEAIQQGKRLTLVCAPAGYGKSTLVIEWLHTHRNADRVAWLSLDDKDNDPALCFTYLVAAIQRIDPHLGQSLRSLLDGPQLPPLATLMTGLINDIAEADEIAEPGRPTEAENPNRIILALDDYHKIRHPLIHEAVQFLLDYQPSNFHLVLITREDPPLSLPKMRVRGDLMEIRAQDLRFTLDEVDLFLRQVSKLELKREWLSSLEARTEGWIAGLQLAALSLRDCGDISAFLDDFRGSHRYVIDYLMDEVLRLQTEETRRFLYQTSILGRFNASLCNAVTGRSDSQEVLNQIDQASLFLIAIDERRQWYRYHHLFGDFLQAACMQASPDEQNLTMLHGRAAEWFEKHGSLPEAVEHALAGRDYPNAGRLIVNAANATISQGGLTTFLRWLRLLPENFIKTNADLLGLYVWCLYFTGNIEEAAGRMDSLQQSGAPPQQPLVQARLLSLNAWNANAREEDETVTLAEKSLALTGDSDPLLRAATLIVLGHGHRRRGDVDRAVEAYRASIQVGQQAGAFVVLVSALNSLVRTLNEQTRRKEAEELIQETRRSLVDSRGRRLPVADLLAFSQAILAYEANELSQAVELACLGRDAGQRFLSNRIMGGDAEWVLVRSYAAQSNWDAAQALIQDLKQQGHYLKWITPMISALEAELHLDHGDLEAAHRCAAGTGCTADDRLHPSREYSCSVYARLLIAQGCPREALRLLDRLESLAVKRSRQAQLISIRVLKALAENTLGNKPAAFEWLHGALSLAAPGRYLRRFLDQGEAVGALLAESKATSEWQAAQPEVQNFVEELRQAFLPTPAPSKQPSTMQAMPQVGGGEQLVQHSQPASVDGLVEPLSEQELKVLSLLSAGLSNQEIAAELVIGLGTVKWHAHNLYGKLGVNSRTQAIARMQELQLS